MFLFILCLLSIDAVSPKQSCKKDKDIAIDYAFVKVIFIPLVKSMTIEMNFSEIQVGKTSF